MKRSSAFLAATAPGFITRTTQMMTKKSGNLMCGQPVDRSWGHRATWELKNIMRALSFFPWLNTQEDLDRLAAANER
jgi:hypothetical protein